MASDDHSSDFERVDALVAEQAAHLRDEQPNIAERSYELVGLGAMVESAVAEAVSECETSLIRSDGLKDRHHLLASRHPMARDRRLQAPLATALTRGADPKSALLEALASLGVDASEAALLLACSASIEYSEPLIRGPAYEELDRCEEAGDEVGAARARRHVRAASDMVDTLRLDPAAVEVPIHADREAAREPYQREDEARALEWCRKKWGSLGGPHDPTFDVMLAEGGLIAQLMCADLKTQAGADHFFRRFSAGNGSRPTLEQLLMAQAIGRGLSIAILAGNDPTAWELVTRAHKALFARQDSLRTVVSQVTGLRERHLREAEINRRRAASGRPPLRDHPGTSLEERATKALEILAGLDHRFASVPASALVDLVRDDRLSHVGIAVQLTAQCGAFDLSPREGSKAEARTKHIRDAYDAAEREARRLAVASSESPTD